MHQNNVLNYVAQKRGEFAILNSNRKWPELELGNYIIIIGKWFSRRVEK
jgi:hypothetical protein